VVAQICDYVYVLYAGRIVEQDATFRMFDHASHPYTKGLMGAVRSLEQKNEVLDTIAGTVPSLLELPAGCSFSPRCSCCTEKCRQEQPQMEEVAPGHLVRCHAAQEVRHG